MLVGGYISRTTAEIVKADGTKVCQIADLPHSNWNAAQVGLVHCVTLSCYTYRNFYLFLFFI